MVFAVSGTIVGEPVTRIVIASCGNEAKAKAVKLYQMTVKSLHRLDTKK